MLLNNIKIRNFKRFNEVDIPLGSPVVFIGPNNSGKSTALQALALWEVGLRRWLEKRGKRSGIEAPESRPGVTINRRDLIAVPIPEANLLWHNLHTRNGTRNDGKPGTQNVRIDILVDGISDAIEWQCGFEFDYANDESFYCRPLRRSETERMPVPAEARANVQFLPPMSGLADREFVKQSGEIAFLIGQGRTAEVLRNLCYGLAEQSDPEGWEVVKEEIARLFKVKLNPPKLLTERSEIVMTYRENGAQLDLSSSGRGLQQTLLLLAYLTANPQSVLLLDEPDAHLEIIRQRQIYRVLTETARRQGSQIIAASHSEIILNEAADRDVVVAFVGKPHRIDDRGAQLAKSLRDIGFDQYYQAEQKGWILYLEGSTDLSILQTFAERVGHAAKEVLDNVFVHYVDTNLPQKARDHFFGVQEAKDDLVGFALFDHLDKNLHDNEQLTIRMWSRREIENYLCQKDTLIAWATFEAERQGNGGLFVTSWVDTMGDCIVRIGDALELLGESPWSPNTPASRFLDALFAEF